MDKPDFFRFMGGREVRSWPLKGGMSAELMGVEIGGADGRLQKVVVRWSETAEFEFKLLQMTKAAGLATPEPYFWDGSALAMEFAAGEMDLAPGDVDEYARQMAEQLAAIHLVDLSGFDVSFLRRRDSQCGEFGRVRPYLGPDGLVGGLDVGRMEALLAKRLPGQGNGVRLTHGDFWAGNMLWRDGKLIAVIDWEEAALGEPLIDLAQARVELIWLFGVGGAEHFTDFYRAKVDIDYTNLPHWDLCATLRLLRLVKGDWGWLVDYARDYGRKELTAAGIGEAYKGWVDKLVGLLAEKDSAD